MARHLDQLASATQALHTAEAMTPILEKRPLPDFVIIGAMKSATTTLQEQLEQQRGIFMCNPKEPNFFGDDENYGKGLVWYSNLFSRAPVGDLTGEASTHYTKLPTYPHSATRMREHLPNARLVYVMRHPVDRLISHYIHEWSQQKIDCEIDAAVVQHPELIAYSQYAMQLAPFLDTFGHKAVLPVFFDRLIRHPQAELERVCKFLGYTGNPEWVQNLKPGNVSSERTRKFPLYRLVIDSPSATWLRRAFIPKSWRNWVRSQLTMRQRPVLSPEVRSSLEIKFDSDLARLGQWLGISLNCKDFKKTTEKQELNWIALRE